MKTLNFKSGLFCLLALILISASLTSCEKEVISEDIVSEEIFDKEETFMLKIPEGMSQEDAVTWIDDMSYDEIKNLNTEVRESEMSSRGCTYYPARRYSTSVSCSGCSNPPAKHTYYYYQYRRCCYSSGCYWRVSYWSTYSCKSYC